MTTPIPFSVSDIKDSLLINPVLKHNNENHIFTRICTDSRAINKTDLFIAIKGDKFDGHNFIAQLASQGIKGFIVEKGFSEKFQPKDNTIAFFETDNTIKALGLLAKFQRRRSNAKVIAITGSSGKTTTRKILGKILNHSFKTLTTKGNFNNEIGLPLTLLELSANHEWAVIEMGMNHEGEISRLSDIANPDIGIITNISAAHLEGLGNIDNIAKAKSEMFENMNHNSTIILNMDDSKYALLQSNAKKNPKIKNIISFGKNKNSDFRADNVSYFQENTNFEILQKNQKTINVKIKSPAPFMVLNSLAAAAAATKAGASQDAVKKGVNAFTPIQGRMNPIKISDNVNLFDDTYNANPESVKQALITLSLVSKHNTSIAVLGDMLELGKDAPYLHEEIGWFAAQNKISKIFTHGNLASFIVKGAVNAGFPIENTMNNTKEKIAQQIIKEIELSTHSSPLWVLVKGSRGMKMEKIIYTMEILMNKDQQLEQSI